MILCFGYDCKVVRFIIVGLAAGGADPPIEFGPQSNVLWKIGEGSDDARLDTLFLCNANFLEGHAAAICRTAHRLHDNKRVVEVYNYVDSNVRMLARMYERRLKVTLIWDTRSVADCPRNRS